MNEQKEGEAVPDGVAPCAGTLAGCAPECGPENRCLPTPRPELIELAAFLVRVLDADQWRRAGPLLRVLGAHPDGGAIPDGGEQHE